MKRLFLLLLPALMIAACGSGDDDTPVTPQPDPQPLQARSLQIHYGLEATPDLLAFYDLSVSYRDIAGTEHTEAVAQSKWMYENQPCAFNLAPSRYACKVTATAKRPLPERLQPTYDLGFESNLHIDVVNADGTVAQTFRPDRASTFSQTLTASALGDLLEACPELTLADYSVEIVFSSLAD